jgi:hypothetical protein
VDLADQHLATLPGHQGHGAVQAMSRACRPWSLHTPGVEDHQAPPRGQGLYGGHGAHLPEPCLHPRSTGPHALRHRLVRDGLIQGRKGPCHLASGWVQATR